MPLTKSTIRRIGFLMGWEKADNEDETESVQDDLSCTITIVCSFLITILTPIYYTFYWKQRKFGFFMLGARVVNQIAYVSIPASIFCICNTIYFFSEVMYVPKHEETALNVFNYRLIFQLPYTEHSSSTRKAVSVIMTLTKSLSVYILCWSCKVFHYYVIFFENLLPCFIILLAVQRFFLIFLPEKVHVLVKPGALRTYIIIIWIFSILKGMLHSCILMAIVVLKKQSKDPERYFNKLSYITFGFLAFVSLIYFTIFIHLYKMPRVNKWSRPEVALLYEGIPLLLTNMFILYYILSDVDRELFYSRYVNYGMRKIVISTALVQFTYIFTFERIVKFFSTDLRVILNRSSMVAPIT